MDSFWDSSDDNAFYQQLTRQILMLTDEDDDPTHTVTTSSVIRKPVVYGSGVGSGPVGYYGWSGSGRCSVPSWMERLWTNGGGGTGVFIPSASGVTAGKKSGRRRHNHNHKTRKSEDRGRMYSVVGQKIHG